MESQPQNPEFRINPENFNQCILHHATGKINYCIEILHFHLLNLYTVWIVKPLVNFSSLRQVPQQEFITSFF